MCLWWWRWWCSHADEEVVARRGAAGGCVLLACALCVYLCICVSVSGHVLFPPLQTNSDDAGGALEAVRFSARARPGSWEAVVAPAKRVGSGDGWRGSACGRCLVVG
ncbi:hypothetical protein PLESTB_001058000 [Pleodorina starrii]|uniref:Uncharacterized protein n=1 Tax=Pleodorina starrii TaxID=330485 RepID=A0A9W6F4M1_9CHLO|nr:hypothetical protein PLESTB_001058000 [Pleodorina starrii]